jgi:CheY-like chemotaxis protein
MITARSQGVAQRQAGTKLAYITLAGATLATTLLVSACSSSGHTTASAHAAASGASAAQQTCQQVDAVLSDGPDPGADPVGYAEAQILPLQQIHTSDQTLNTAISTLAGAYQSYYAAHGAGSTTKSSLNTAINRINSLCPGAGATT